MIERLDEARKYCRRLINAIDVGANRGLYSIEMAKYFTNVFAFEPVIKNFNELISNTWDCPNVYGYMFGVSDSKRDAVFDISGKPQGYHISDSAEVAEVCNLVTLDEFFDGTVKPDFIKIDVEGHELEVLRGAEKMIIQNRPVVMIEEKFDDRFSASRLLEQWGYSQVWRKKHDRLFVCKSL